MKMHKIGIILGLILYVNSLFGSYGSARRFYESSKVKNSQELFVKLVDAKLYFSALPLIKEILVGNAGSLSPKTERAFSKLIRKVGVKQFETLPLKFLARTKSSNIKYIMAKKAFRDEKHSTALAYLKKIPRRHPIYPFAKNMEATIYSVVGQQDKAFDSFFVCERSSNSRMSGSKRRDYKKLKLNRDYCVVGKARVKYAQKEFDQSDLLYLDLPKSSSVWPEMLFEEAWNSYYQSNYNRSLGKLVSYNAPVFDYYFNPEVDVLEALSYLKLCLYGDAQKTVDEFNKRYYADTRYFRRLVQKLGKGYKKYFALLNRYERFGKAPNTLLRSLFKNIVNEIVYVDLKAQMVANIRELDRIRANKKGRFNTFLYKNAQESLRSYQLVMGSYIRSKLVSFYAQLYKSFEGMSYIKLEVLAQKKAKLYSFENTDRTRGDIKYIQRNEKQYFWDFNGEFWADELGDYVFALKSEC